MRQILVENILKNFIVIVVLILLYPEITNFLLNSSLASDKAGLGSFLVAVSILAVTACFGNFAFTYEKIEQAKLSWRIVAHVTTGILMLLIGLSLEMTSVLAGMLMGTFWIFDFSLILLFLASVLYDFWDLNRLK